LLIQRYKNEDNKSSVFSFLKKFKPTVNNVREEVLFSWSTKIFEEIEEYFLHLNWTGAFYGIVSPKQATIFFSLWKRIN
jgi:hypothetical protein